MSEWRGRHEVLLSPKDLHLWKEKLNNNDPKLTRDAYHAM